MGDEVGAAAAGVPGHTHLGRWHPALELNSRPCFYQMLEDDPALTAIYPGIEASDVRPIVVDTAAARLGLPPFEG